MKTRASIFCLLAIITLQSGPTALGQDQGSGEKARYVDPPWHFVDIWWDLGKSEPFESYSIDVTISADLHPSTNLDIAPIGLGHLNKTPFYGGIQTQIDGHTKTDPAIRKLGPGFLFSMWNERSLDAIRPSVGGFCQSSGHEGDFVSIRLPYEWHKGRYTYKLVRLDREVIGGKPHTWVGVFVRSHETDENIFVGALRFPGEDLKLDRKVASFVEVYGGRIPVGEIPHVTVTLGNLVVNGKPAGLSSAEAIYPKGVPDYADAIAKDNDLVITVGKPVKGRTKRSVRLLPAVDGKP